MVRVGQNKGLVTFICSIAADSFKFRVYALHTQGSLKFSDVLNLLVLATQRVFLCLIILQRAKTIHEMCLLIK